LNTWPMADQLRHGTASREEVIEALRDDLNTPLAISILDRILKSGVSLNLRRGEQHLNDATYRGVVTARMLGFLTMTPEEWFKGHADEDAVEHRIAERSAAKQARDFVTADRIRDELKAEGIILEDGPGGTTWRRE
jgi:cysteinyl-tRNA synthetase